MSVEFLNIVVDTPSLHPQWKSYERVFSHLTEGVLLRAAKYHNVFLWSTERNMRKLESLMDGLGYTLHIRLVWNKGKTHEYLLWFYKGKLPAINPLAKNRFSSVFSAAGTRSGAKPDVAYEIIRGYYPSGISVEVFGKGDRPEWIQWKERNQLL